jgi:AraC-like DNA-binding protein
MSKENTQICDNGSAIRDIADERNTLWRLDSWQQHEMVPAGIAYGHGSDQLHFHSRQDNSVVLQYTIKGLVRFNYKGEERQVPAGHAYIFPSHMEPRWKTKDDPDYHLFWVNISGAGLYEHWQLLRDVHGPAIAMDLDGPVMQACKKMIALHEQGADLSTEALAIHAFVMALYQHCEQGQAEKLQPVQRALQHILRYPFHAHSLKEIAKDHGVSREHLARVFTEELGESPGTWLREQRYDRAMQLLISTNIPIKDIVFQSGFGSVDSFARLMQIRHQCTPTNYRLRNSRAGI